MKRLFSVLMLAVVATLTFAFTTPKSDAAFATPYFFNGSIWVEGTADECEGIEQACQFTSDLALDPSEVLEVVNRINTQSVKNAPIFDFELSTEKVVDITLIELRD